MTTSGKLIRLEAMRGIAALIVVANHLCFAFSSHSFWFSSPLYIFVNGGAAVTFFFVLSGYVLSIGPLQKRNTSLIFDGAIKRWPRLALPVLIAVLTSWSLWHFGLFRNVDGSAITGSEWLRNFGGSFKPDSVPNMTLAAAVSQGTWRTFFLGESYFDSSLWTMKFEMFGSIIVFIVALLTLSTEKRYLKIALFCAVAILLAWRNTIYLAFLSGLILAWVQSEFQVRLSKIKATVLICLAFYLFGFSPNVDGVVPRIDFYGWMPIQSAITIHCLASILLMMGMVFCSEVGRHFDGTLGAQLGRYSFPVYLLHILIIMSIGMIVFLKLEPTIGFALAASLSIGISLVVTFIAATLLAVVEQHWITVVRRIPKILNGTAHQLRVRYKNPIA